VEKASHGFWGAFFFSQKQSCCIAHNRTKNFIFVFNGFRWKNLNYIAAQQKVMLAYFHP
jgi:hypothetical protein